MIPVYVLKIDRDIYHEDTHPYEHWVDAAKRKKIAGFKRKEDAWRCLLSDLLIRYVMCRYFGFSLQHLSYDYNPFGKPSIAHQKQWHFNVAHSGDWVVAAINSAPIGIDIEQMTAVDLDIAMHYFSKWEQQQLFSLPLFMQPSYFFELWTLKESFLKCEGSGLSTPLSSFSIIKPSGNEIALYNDKHQLLPYSFSQPNVDADYKMAICTPESLAAIDVHSVALPLLMDYFLQKKL